MTVTKTRFAPSPTGFIHLGNARTALFSALYARHCQGSFLLRIEDTDLERSRQEYIDALMHDLTWLGVNAQEGEGVGGDYAPYRQSKRADIYAHYYQTLIDQGIAYDCFCSEDELELERKLQRASGQPPRYSGKCRHLTPSERAQRVESGIKPTLRFHVKDEVKIEFTDLVRGPQVFFGVDIGDFIIRRGDGGASFMFCSVLDDALMKVTHVLRGEDHLTNTPRQLMILQALNLAAPQYGHLSIINGSDGTPLSKRNGSRSIRELREAGFLPLAVINYMARLGHYYACNDFLSFEALAEQFDLAHLGRSPARFDEDQLIYWQKTAVQQLSDEALIHWLGEAILSEVPADKRLLFVNAVRENSVFPKDAEIFAKKLFSDDFHLSPEHQDLIKSAHPQFFQEALAALEQNGADFDAISKHLEAKLNVKGKALFQPLRLALTDQMHGPKLGILLELIGKERCAKRFKTCQ